jgi:hypothetical protein
MVADDSMIRAKKPDAIVFLRTKWPESPIRKAMVIPLVLNIS